MAAISLRPHASFGDRLDPWFAKDARGQSCASCHSPDGIELRAFSDSDLRRRISRHHQGATADAIRTLVESGPSEKANGLEIRPMQPGGSLLTGATPAVRDAKFLANLASRYPILFKPVRTLADAERFQKAILNIDLRSLPVGIEMNRLSEDGAHGLEHATFANWFPDVSSFDADLVRPEADAYLKNPTAESLRQLDAKVVRVAKANDPFALLSLAKYRALLVYQHELRNKKPVAGVPDGNPFWQVAEFGRIYEQADSVALRIPDDIVAAKNVGTTLKGQMRQLRLPWYWLGWTRDPSLTKSGRMKETLRAEYFCRYLESDGPYLSHEAFMLTRKLAEQTRNPILPNYPFEIQYSYFIVNDPLVKREPKDPTTKRQFRQFVDNSFTMSLLLLEKDLLTKKKAIRPFPQGNQIKFISQYLTDIKDPQTLLVERVKKLLAQTPAM